jgi:hypothetical protein
MAVPKRRHSNSRTGTTAFARREEAEAIDVLSQLPLCGANPRRLPELRLTTWVGGSSSRIRTRCEPIRLGSASSTCAVAGDRLAELGPLIARHCGRRHGWLPHDHGFADRVAVPRPGGSVGRHGASAPASRFPPLGSSMSVPRRCWATTLAAICFEGPAGVARFDGAQPAGACLSPVWRPLEWLRGACNRMHVSKRARGRRA